jgi:hypothetical protein
MSFLRGRTERMRQRLKALRSARNKVPLASLHRKLPACQE